MDVKPRFKKIIKRFFENQEGFNKIVLKDINISQKFRFNEDSGFFDEIGYFVEVIIDRDSFSNAETNISEVFSTLEKTFGFECIVEFN